MKEEEVPGCLTPRRASREVFFFGFCWRETVQGQDDSRRDLGKVLTALPAKVSLKSPAFLQ